MSDRKVYAKIESTILVPIRVQREVILRVDDDYPVENAIQEAARGVVCTKWDYEDEGNLSLQDSSDDIDERLSELDLNSVLSNSTTDNISVTDVK